jgi:hypothetical protein
MGKLKRASLAAENAPPVSSMTQRTWDQSEAKLIKLPVKRQIQARLG